MKKTLYDQKRATALVPLLSSITREMQERHTELSGLERRIETLSDQTRPDEQRLRSLVAEASVHRRELRLAKEELLGLGCSIVGTDPLTIRIPGERGNARRSFVWRSGDPAFR